MGFSFRKSVRFGPVRFNLSKSGIGTSIGVKGLRVGVDSKGRTYGSAGIPGTGIYGRKYATSNGKGDTAPSQQHLNISTTLADIREKANINSLGFNFNYTYYQGSDSKGCLLVFAWILGLGLLSIPPVGIPYLLVLFFYQRKKSKEPETVFRKAFASAFTHVTSGDYYKALTFLDKCKQLDPNNIDYLDLSGVCNYQSKRYDVAASFFERVYKVRSNDIRTQTLLADSLRQLNQPEDYHRLIELYTDILVTQPDDENKFILGYYLSLEKRFNESIAVLQKITPESDMYIQALNGIATCYSELHEYQKGIEVLKFAPLRQKQLDDNLKAVHYNLGELYEAVGDKVNALKHYTIIEIQDINYLDVKARIQKLAS
jgi:tetratricopeptide (TPR) repeat protein